MTKELFIITEENLETGLRGYPVGYCDTSFVNPEKGLYYVDESIDKLATWKPEEVIFLLMHKRKGEPQEIKDFAAELSVHATLSDQVIKSIEALPKKGHPMKWFSIAILLLGMLEGKGDYRKDCFDLIAKLPHLTAVVINAHAGWGRTPFPIRPLGIWRIFSG